MKASKKTSIVSEIEESKAGKEAKEVAKMIFLFEDRHGDYPYPRYKQEFERIIDFVTSSGKRGRKNDKD